MRVVKAAPEFLCYSSCKRGTKVLRELVDRRGTSSGSRAQREPASRSHTSGTPTNSKDYWPHPGPIHSLLPPDAFLRMRWWRRSFLREGENNPDEQFDLWSYYLPQRGWVNLKQLKLKPRDEATFNCLSNPLFHHYWKEWDSADNTSSLQKMVFADLPEL